MNPGRAPAFDGRGAPSGEDAAAQAALVAAAQGGDAEALEALVASVRDRVYRLALRMVARPADAEDATQEILIRVVTRLGSFRGEAAFTTWVHRVAVNHLLDRRRSCVERMEMTFDDYAEDLRAGLSDAAPSDPDAELLAAEVRLSCTLALLTCLDRPHRVAYVLGEILEMGSDEAAWVCEVPPATYRKRLSRARSRVRAFLGEHCGVVAPDRADCRCSARVGTAVTLGRIDPDRLELARHTTGELERLADAVGLMRGHPAYPAPRAVSERISAVIRSGTHPALTDD
ncbi:MAG: RNA polymerase sigma factor [Actinomycetota bacterium]|nr:RNA polymerase sigma factor [Actinomycetota bacterium]